MVCAVKHKAAGLVDGQCSGARGRIWNLACMNGQSLGFEGVIAHEASNRALGRNNAGVDAYPIETAKNSGVFNFDAAVGDRLSI